MIDETILAVQLLEKQLNKYKRAYELFMDYFNELSPESRIEVDKQLKQLDL